MGFWAFACVFFLISLGYNIAAPAAFALNILYDSCFAFSFLTFLTFVESFVSVFRVGTFWHKKTGVLYDQEPRDICRDKTSEGFRHDEAPHHHCLDHIGIPAVCNHTSSYTYMLYRLCSSSLFFPFRAPCPVTRALVLVYSSSFYTYLPTVSIGFLYFFLELPIHPMVK